MKPRVPRDKSLYFRPSSIKPPTTAGPRPTGCPPYAELWEIDAETKRLDKLVKREERKYESAALKEQQQRPIKKALDDTEKVPTKRDPEAVKQTEIPRQYNGAVALQLNEVATAHIGHCSEDLLVEKSPSRYQFKNSSGIEPVLSAPQEEKRSTVDRSESQDPCSPLPPILDDKIGVKPISSVQSESTSSQCDTLSSTTEEESDWGQDEITGSLQDLQFSDFSAFSREIMSSGGQNKDHLTRRVFSPMQQQLIDRLMKDFWATFDQELGVTL
jgi:hypothetical protein